MTEHAKRWEWHEAAATDPNVTDSIARTVMILVGFANQDTGLMSAAEATIAAKRRLSPKQVSRHLEKLVDLGYLTITHKGGGTKWIKRGAGMVQVGRATEYMITLPGHAECPSTDVEADTLLGHSEPPTRTFSAPYSDTLDVLGTSSEPSSNQIEASAILDKEEKVPHHPVLRPASMKERALWHGVWPDESDLVATSLDTALDAKTALAKAMVWLLGYRSADTVEDLQARTEKRVEIQHALDDRTVHTMRMMSAARKLRKADLADWLAINGFAPITKEDADEQAA